jgi:hypothetical protein
VRTELYYFYRYWLGLGFTEKRAARYFHFMQARWYRTLVEVKLFEIEQEARARGESVAAAIERKYKIKLSRS